MAADQIRFCPNKDNKKNSHHFLSRSIFSRVLLAGLFVWTTPHAASAEGTEKCGPFDGKTPTPVELKQILANHQQWHQKHGSFVATLKSQEDALRANLCRANLQNADLRKASLNHADLRYVDLSGADLRQADISHSNFFKANLNHAKLNKADLNHTYLEGGTLLHADLSGADLTKTWLRNADLSKTVLSQAKLSGAELQKANLTMARLDNAILKSANIRGALFEPMPLQSIEGLYGVHGLSHIQFHNFAAVIALRNKFKAAGGKTEERALNAALRKQSLSEARLVEKLTWAILFGGLLTDYGAQPVWLGWILLVVCFLFVWPYAWLTWQQRQTGIAALKQAVYFSLLSAFNLGWRRFRLMQLFKAQQEMHDLKWIGIISNLQTLLCLYLVMTGVLAYLEWFW